MSDQIKNGGPAFPAFDTIDQWDRDAEKYRETIAPMGGMSLRDYFAAKALQGFVTALKTQDVEPYNSVAISRCSYELADAMLVARGK